MGEKVLEIDQLFRAIKKGILLIIVLTSITTGLAIYSTSKLMPSYSASLKIFLGSKDNMMTIYSDEELSYYGQFMETFKEILGVDEFIESSLNKYNLNISASQVRGGLQITGSQKTPIYTLSYSSYDKEMASKVLEAVSDELGNQVAKLIPGKSIEVINNVSVATIMPDKKKKVILGFGAGIAISLVIIFIKYYLDDTVKSKDSLEKLLPVTVLGEIPIHEKSFRKEEKISANNKRNSELNISRSV
ncbi:MAG: Wzz/FepE/Etk N-terminal domain-containing protein [Clostridium sp.]|nr:Wzz/FepE/Etk N-terminal domain-containing protein [Clostridium sp.]